MTHYDTLGVPKDADAATIKRAYRRKAKAAHPDKGGDTRVMVAINRAHDTLGDPEKRARYDQTGEDGPAPKSTDSMARDALTQIFMAIVEQANDYTNVIEEVARQLKANKDRIQNDIATQAKRVTKLERSLKRLKHKGRQENFLAALLADQIAKTNAGIEQARNGIAAIERARDMLSDFSWQADEQPAAPTYGVYTVYGAADLGESFADMLKRAGFGSGGAP